MSQELLRILEPTVLERSIEFHVINEPEVSELGEAFIQKINDILGGGNIGERRGFWGKYDEKVNVVQVYHNMSLLERLELFEAFTQYGIDANQEALFFTEDNIGYTYDPKTAIERFNRN